MLPLICLHLKTVLYSLSHLNNVRFVFTSSCLWEGLCLIYIIYVCFGIMVSKTCCVVFLFCFSSSCVPYVASFSGLSIFDCPFLISNFPFHYQTGTSYMPMHMNKYEEVIVEWIFFFCNFRIRQLKMHFQLNNDDRG